MIATAHTIPAGGALVIEVETLRLALGLVKPFRAIAAIRTTIAGINAGTNCGPMTRSLQAGDVWTPVQRPIDVTERVSLTGAAGSIVSILWEV